jgi:hypothetical protein
MQINENNESIIKAILAMLLIIATILIISLVNGCRSRQIKRTEYYRSGEIAAIIYTDENGFHFFSDGEGKTLSPNLNINGVTF